MIFSVTPTDLWLTACSVLCECLWKKIISTVYHPTPEEFQLFMFWFVFNIIFVTNLIWKRLKCLLFFKREHFSCLVPKIIPFNVWIAHNNPSRCNDFKAFFQRIVQWQFKSFDDWYIKICVFFVYKWEKHYYHCFVERALSCNAMSYGMACARPSLTIFGLSRAVEHLVSMQTSVWFYLFWGWSMFSRGVKRTTPKKSIVRRNMPPIYWQSGPANYTSITRF